MVATERPFPSRKAVDRTNAKFMVWARSWRGDRFESEENMLSEDSEALDVVMELEKTGCCTLVSRAVEPSMVAYALRQRIAIISERSLHVNIVTVKCV